MLLMLSVNNCFVLLHTGGISTTEKSTHIPHCTGIMILSWIWLLLWRVSERKIKTETKQLKNPTKTQENLHQTEVSEIWSVAADREESIEAPSLSTY